MRIALIIEHFDATRGGAEHFTVWLAKELAQRGHEVHVVCHDVAARVNRYRQATQRASHDADRSHQAHGAAEAVHEGIHIHRLRGMKLNTGLGFRLFGARARRWCRENPPQIVHSVSVAFAGDIYQSHAGVYAAIQAQAVSSRTTQTAATWKQIMLHLSGKQRTLLALERRALQGANGRTARGPKRILSLSAMMTEQLHAYYGVPATRGGGASQSTDDRRNEAGSRSGAARSGVVPHALPALAGGSGGRVRRPRFSPQGPALCHRGDRQNAPVEAAGGRPGQGPRICGTGRFAGNRRCGADAPAPTPPQAIPPTPGGACFLSARHARCRRSTPPRMR